MRFFAGEGGDQTADITGLFYWLVPAELVVCVYVYAALGRSSSESRNGTTSAFGALRPPQPNPPIECLNANWFVNLAGARQKIESGWQQHNTDLPRSSSREKVN